ncbi:MAG: hypothetical protein ABF683_10270 [Sporolactobacillus sp.]
MAEDRKNHEPIHIRFNGETHTLDEWTKKESAADKEHFLDWSDAFPEMHDESAQQREPVPYHPKKGRPPFLHGSPSRLHPSVRQIFHLLRLFLLPAASAIIIGQANVFTMLLLFSGQKQQTSSTWQGTEAQASSAQTHPINDENIQITTYLLQAGVYSTKDKAQEAASLLRGKGLAVLTGGSKETALFIAAARKSSGAQQLAAYYKSQGVVVYQKQLRFKAAKKPAVLQNKKNSVFVLTTRAMILLMATDPSIGSGGKIHPQLSVPKQLQTQADRLQKISVQTDSPRLASMVSAIKKTAQHAETRAKASADAQTGQSFASYQEALLELIALYQGLIDLPSSAMEK